MHHLDWFVRQLVRLRNTCTPDYSMATAARSGLTMFAYHLNYQATFLPVVFIMDTDIATLNCSFFATDINQFRFEDRKKSLIARISMYK